MRGRKPKPTFLRLIEGNPGHRPLNSDEPQPEGALIDAPESFTPAQRRLWSSELAKAPEGMLRKLDIGAFSSYIMFYAEMLEADRKIQQLGAVVKLKSGQPMQNPYISIRNRANQAMMRAAVELGFTPSSRSRVKIPKQKAKSGFGKLNEFKF